ncbi:MAG TPA: hypothetical protein PLQ81_12335, partial [bacterium]|nr:hypothetical protein [bacterium]
MKKNVVCITMGCPSGIGPEIIAKAAAQKKINLAETAVFGDYNIINHYINLYKLKLKINRFYQFDDKTCLRPNELNLLDFNNCDLSKIKFGKVSAESGKAS